MGCFFPRNIASSCFFSAVISLFCLLSAALLSGCGPTKPIYLVEEHDLPLFIDDEDRSSLLTGARRQLDYLRTLPEDHCVWMGDRKYTKSWLIHSLNAFIAIVKETPDQLQLNRKIRGGFLVFRAAGRGGTAHRKMLVTGYYEPVFQGSLTALPPYLYPLYSLPDTLVKRALNTAGETEVGRYDASGAFVSFWTRAEIDTTDVLEGHELVYLQDPFETFLLHVQGSGRIRLPDNTVRSVRFAGHNGHRYNSIGKLLVDEGRIALAEASIPTIRAYLRDHPEDMTRVLHHNPRYIFFRWGSDSPPEGSTGVALTPGRSIAVDRQALPAETVGYLVSRKPLVDSDGSILGWAPLNRFVLPQDSGSAIKGAGRVDLFYGAGVYAEAAAGHSAESGDLYFLIKKGYPSGGNDLPAQARKE